MRILETAMEMQNEEPRFVLCFHAGNSVTWTMMHSKESEGETFESIHFDSDHVRLYTDAGREVIIPDFAYETVIDDPEAIENHEVQEFDSYGIRDRKYVVTTPVVTHAPSFGG